MSEKSDDIKQLFSHLGLNPNDYQEIRSAPTANATATEAPRRWSLLQAIAPQQPVAPRVAPVANFAAAVAPTASVLPAALAPMLSPTAALAAVRASSVRDEAANMPPPVLGPDPVEAISGRGSASTTSESLHSLFQSVKEPQTVAAPPPPPPSSAMNLPPDRPTDRLYRELQNKSQSASSRIADAMQQWSQDSQLPGLNSEPETRLVGTPPPAQAAPLPLVEPLPPIAVPVVPRPVVATAAQAARIAPIMLPHPNPVVAASLLATFQRLSQPEPPRAPADGRLRLNYRSAAGAAQAAKHDDRLEDVFRRISGQNSATK